jgi:hypothetical protein
MKKLGKWYFDLNIYLKLFPFLILYLIICIFLSTNKLRYDEARYVMFAKNLINGFFSPPYPEINLWNGPGYPLLIAPIIFLKLPLSLLKLLNAFLLYSSLIISYKTFRLYSSNKEACFFSIILGLYFPIFTDLPIIWTECLTWFFISLVSNLFLRNYLKNNIEWKFIFLSGLSIAYLAMIKVIFGYAIIIMCFFSIFLYLIPRYKLSAKKSVLIFSISFIFCLPWLFYTFKLTNKIFYWTNSAGMSLYTMSTPHKGELGDWNRIEKLSVNPNHRTFIDSISKLNEIDKDMAFKKVALSNIKNHPGKYIENWFANIGRLFFSYPFSEKKQSLSTYFTFIPNMFIIVIIVFAIIGIFFNSRKFPEGLFLLFAFIFIYLSGSSLVSAYRRMFYISIPFWFVFISYVFTNIITIKIKKD